jgi:hypothetical protein
MRVTQVETAFQPVTINLDSQSEVDTFRELLRIAFNESPSGSDVERMADELRDNFDANVSGWQSSSASC